MIIEAEEETKMTSTVAGSTMPKTSGAIEIQPLADTMLVILNDLIVIVAGGIEIIVRMVNVTDTEMEHADSRGPTSFRMLRHVTQAYTILQYHTVCRRQYDVDGVVDRL